MQSIILIPSYKPDGRLTDLARALRDKGQAVVIVDDGSGAAYRTVFDKAQLFAQVVACEENGGKGTAIKAGLAFIQAHFQPPYTVTTADGDGQHCLRDILRVAKAARKRRDALVLGCRTVSRNMPLRNWFGNFYTKIAFLLATGKFTRDTQTGLRGFSDCLLPFMLSIKGSRYEYEINVLMHWVRCNRPLTEVPIHTIYHDGNSLSHFRAVRDSAIIYGEILKFSALPFLCFTADVLLFCLLYDGILPKGYWWEPALANAVARALSGAGHLFFLKRQAERKPLPRKVSAARYAAFAAGAFAVNTLALWALSLTGMPLVWAKILTDVATYFLTFIPQRRRLFTKPEKGE